MRSQVRFLLAPQGNPVINEFVLGWKLSGKAAVTVKAHAKDLNDFLKRRPIPCLASAKTWLSQTPSISRRRGKAPSAHAWCRGRAVQALRNGGSEIRYELQQASQEGQWRHDIPVHDLENRGLINFREVGVS